MVLNQYDSDPWEASKNNDLGEDGQTANNLMNIILDDIGNCIPNGIEWASASGEQCVVFLNPVYLIEDWSALAFLTDATGLSADVFFSLCLLPR